MTDPSETVSDLGDDVTLRCSFPAPGSVHLRVTLLDHTLIDAMLTPDNRRHSVQIKNALIRSDCGIEVDFFAGEVSWTAHIAARELDLDWRTIIDVTDRVILRFDPSIGMINGDTAVNAPLVDDPRWGSSVMSSPTVLRLHVDDDPRKLAGVGKLVKNQMFAGYCPFTFNTVACCGGVPRGHPGVYSDPESIWFNVFFGIYQLDCAKADGWDRPFGYESAAGAASVVKSEDLVRLGKADWNWFSNYMYGVPPAICVQHSNVDMTAVTITPAQLVAIGSSRWHHLSMSGIDVASCYQSDAPGAAKLVKNTSATGIWQEAFGLPCPRPAFPVSFIATNVVASLDIAYWEDDAAFHTVVFGGTSGAESDPNFLDAQLMATRLVIAKSYADRGFPNP